MFPPSLFVLCFVLELARARACSEDIVIICVYPHLLFSISVGVEAFASFQRFEPHTCISDMDSAH